MEIVIGVVGVVVAIIFGVIAVVQGRGHRGQARPLRGADARTITVTPGSSFPVFDQADGSQDLGDHMVSVTIANTSDTRVSVKSWGISCGGGKNLFVTKPIRWDPPLPRWLEPGEDFSVHISAADVRRIHVDENIAYDEMVPWVTTGDGRTFRASRGVPLAD
jgi:hypothetical protein